MYSYMVDTQSFEAHFVNYVCVQVLSLKNGIPVYYMCNWHNVGGIKLEFVLLLLLQASLGNSSPCLIKSPYFLSERKRQWAGIWSFRSPRVEKWWNEDGGEKSRFKKIGRTLKYVTKKLENSFFPVPTSVCGSLEMSRPVKSLYTYVCTYTMQMLKSEWFGSKNNVPPFFFFSWRRVDSFKVEYMQFREPPGDRVS